MLFIAIGIAAGIGYSIVTLINTAQISLSVQANQVRLQNISNSIRAGLTTDGGNVLLPVMTDANGKVLARLPSSSPFSTTTSGADIVYCPAFPDAASADTAINRLPGGNSETFGVATTQLAGKTYVKAGHAEYANNKPDGVPIAERLAEMGVIAYLLSPQPNYNGSLRCADVEFATDNYTLLVNGGSVVPIYTITTDARGSIFVLSEDGKVPSGYNGTDRIVRTLGDVANFIEQYQLADVTVRLPEPMTVSLTDFQSFIASGASRTLRMVPETASDGTQIAHATLTVDAGTNSVASSNIYFEVTGRLHLTGVKMVGVMHATDEPLDKRNFDVAFDAQPSADIVLVDSQVAGIKTSGGRISTSGTTSIVPISGDDTVINPVDAQGGEIVLRSSANPAVAAPNASIVFRSNAGTINLSQGLKVATRTGAALAVTDNGGRIVVPTKGGELPELDVVRDGVLHHEKISFRETVSKLCDVGHTTCTAQCTPGKVVITGGCSNASGTPLISFGAEQLDTFSCGFASMPSPIAPKATAVCDYR